MIFGLKLWSSNSNLFTSAIKYFERGQFDFIELAYDPRAPRHDAKIFSGIPITVHFPTEIFGFNLMQEFTRNDELITRTIEFAHILGAEKLIVHPGAGNSLTTLLNNLRKIKYRQVFIENMPKIGLPELGMDTCYGYNVDHLHRLKDAGYKLCLDINHGIKSAIAQKRPYQEYLLLLRGFKPSYFHISDGSLNKVYDEHLNLGEGEYDLKWIKKHLLNKQSHCVVLETPKIGNSLENDIRNLKYLKKL